MIYDNEKCKGNNTKINDENTTRDGNKKVFGNFFIKKYQDHGKKIKKWPELNIKKNKPRVVWLDMIKII